MGQSSTFMLSGNIADMKDLLHMSAIGLAICTMHFLTINNIVIPSYP